MSSVSLIVFLVFLYSFGIVGVGFMLVGFFIGNVLGLLYVGVFGDWIGVYKVKCNNGIFEFEFRLYFLVLLLVFMGGGFIFYGVFI